MRSRRLRVRSPSIMPEVTRPERELKDVWERLECADTAEVVVST